LPSLDLEINSSLRQAPDPHLLSLSIVFEETPALLSFSPSEKS
jgi:hypothetical protein